MLSLSDNNQADVIETFNSTLNYLDHFKNIDTLYFEQMVGQIYHSKLQSDKHISLILKSPLDVD